MRPKTQSMKKMRLHRETLRRLVPDRLAAVAGGGPTLFCNPPTFDFTCFDGCTEACSDTCPGNC
jgi:hypothetical protein